MNVAAAIATLRDSADSLAVDTAIWAARDPADLSREAIRAREDALRTIDATMAGLSRLRRELAHGVHRVRRKR